MEDLETWSADIEEAIPSIMSNKAACKLCEELGEDFSWETCKHFGNTPSAKNKANKNPREHLDDYFLNFLDNYIDNYTPINHGSRTGIYLNTHRHVIPFQGMLSGKSYVDLSRYAEENNRQIIQSIPIFPYAHTQDNTIELHRHTLRVFDKIRRRFGNEKELHLFASMGSGPVPNIIFMEAYLNFMSGLIEMDKTPNWYLFYLTYDFFFDGEKNQIGHHSHVSYASILSKKLVMDIEKKSSQITQLELELSEKTSEIDKLELGLSEKTSEIFYLKSKMRKLFGQQHTISDDIGKLIEEE